MSSRRYERSEVMYDDRRDRDYASRAGGSRYDDDSRYVEQEIEFRRSAPPVRERERERERDREEFEFREDRTRVRDPPAFLRDDYGRTSAGPVVLRAREREEFDFVPRSRRRSPSPEIDKRTERESIIIRRDKEESESRPPPRRERSRDREEIIIRRDDRERARPAPPPPPSPPPPQEEVQREEIIIRRQERSRSIPPARDEGETERIIIRRREDDDRASRYEPPPPREFEREEIVIRRDRDRDRDEDARSYAPPPPPPSRRNIDYALVRPKSRERERSVAHDSDSEHEITIRREEIKDRGRSTEREEIIIRSRSHSSPSPAPSLRSVKSTKSMKSTRSSRPAPPPEPQVVYAPQIHQEVITHHRHVDHGYEVAIPQRPRPVSRPPSPPSPPSLPSPSPSLPPPPAREQSEERIEIKRSGERNGRAYAEDIVIDRTEGARSVPPPPAPRYDPPAPRRESRYRDDRDMEEEAEYYNQRALERSYPGEAWHGATRDWALVDVPPGTRRVRMDGAGGGAQEVSWQRYNGMRRSKFYPEADEDEAYSNIDYTREITREVSRPAPPPPAPAPKPEPPPSSSSGDIGRRYGKTPDPKAGLWTEITKDLVIKEAITQMGYEYEETDEFYYIIAYLKYDDVARLVGLSEDIRKERRRRVKEIEWETKIETEPPRRPLAIEPPAPVRSPRPPKYDREWEREEDRYIEREIIYRGNRPPPPPGRRR